MTSPLGTFHNTPDHGEPWIGYVRVSMYKEEQISPELQRQAITDWARHTGRRIVDWVEDLDVSGRHFRRKIMRCIERVEAREARGVAVWRYSRFGRDRTGNAINLARLQKAGGQLESATEPVDARTAIGRFQRGMILEFAAYESDRAGEQWVETHDHRRSNGLPATGRPRWGYIWHPRRIPDGRGGWTTQQERYEVDPEYTDLHTHLYDSYNAGATFTALVDELNTARQYTVAGNPWEISTLARWMDSGWAAGLLRIHDKSACRNDTCDGRRCPHYTHIEGAHQPSIGPGPEVPWADASDADRAAVRAAAAEKWKAYQARRATAQRTPPRTLQGSYVLTGLVRCGLCRGACRIASYASRSRRQNVPGYALRCMKRSHAGKSVCAGTWSRRVVVEDAVFEWLADRAAADIDAAPGTTAPPMTMPSTTTTRADHRRRLERERAEAQAAITRLMVARAKNPDLYPDEAFAAAKAELDRDEATAAAALARLDEEADAQPTEDDLRPVAVGLLLEWETLPPKARNAILRQLIRRVVMQPVGEGDERHYEYQVHPLWEPDPWADQEESAPALAPAAVPVA